MGEIRVFPHQQKGPGSATSQLAILQRNFLSRQHRFAFITGISKILSTANNAELNRQMLDQLIHIEATALNAVDAQPTDFTNISAARRKMLELLNASHRDDYADFLTCMGVGYYNCGEYQNSINVFTSLLVGPVGCDTALVRKELATAAASLAEQWLLGSEGMRDNAAKLLDTALVHIKHARQKELEGLCPIEVFELNLLERRITAQALVLRGPDAGLEYACKEMIIERTEGDEPVIIGAINTVAALIARARQVKSTKNPIHGVLGSDDPIDYRLALEYEELRQKIADAAKVNYQPRTFIINIYRMELLILERQVLDPGPFLDSIRQIIKKNEELDDCLEIIYTDYLSGLPQAVKDHILVQVLLEGAEANALEDIHGAEVPLPISFTIKWLARNMSREQLFSLAETLYSTDQVLGKRLNGWLAYAYIDFLLEQPDKKVKDDILSVLKTAKGPKKEMFFQLILQAAEKNSREKLKNLRQERKATLAEEKASEQAARAAARKQELIALAKDSGLNLSQARELASMLDDKDALDLIKTWTRDKASFGSAVLLSEILWQKSSQLQSQILDLFKSLLAEDKVFGLAIEHLKTIWNELNSKVSEWVEAEKKKIQDGTIKAPGFKDVPREPEIKAYPEKEIIFDLFFRKLKRISQASELYKKVTGQPFLAPARFLSCWNMQLGAKLLELENMALSQQKQKIIRTRMALLEQAIEIDNTNLSAYIELIKLQLTQNQLAAAEALLDKVPYCNNDEAVKIGIFSLKSQWLYFLIAELETNAELEKAEVLLLAHQELMRGQQIEAIFKKSNEDYFIRQNKHLILMNLGLSCLCARHYEEAREIFEGLIKENEKDLAAIFGLTNTLVFQGEMDKALSFLENLLSKFTAGNNVKEDDPLLAELYTCYADVLYVADRHVGAADFVFYKIDCLNQLSNNRYHIVDKDAEEISQSLEEIKAQIDQMPLGKEKNKLLAYYYLVKAELQFKQMTACDAATRRSIEDSFDKSLGILWQTPHLLLPVLSAMFSKARILAEIGFKLFKEGKADLAKEYVVKAYRAYEVMMERWPQFTPCRVKMLAVLSLDPNTNRNRIIEHEELLLAPDKIHGFNDSALYVLFVLMLLGNEQKLLEIFNDFEQRSPRFKYYFMRALARVKTIDSLPQEIIEAMARHGISREELAGINLKVIEPRQVNFPTVYELMTRFLRKTSPKQIKETAEQSLIREEFEDAFNLLNGQLLLTKDEQFKPEIAKTLFLWACKLVEQGDTASARQKLEQALIHEPDNNKAKTMLAKMLISAHEYQRAITLAQQVLKARPDDVVTMNVLGYAHFCLHEDGQKEGHLSEARRLFEKILSINSDLPEAFFNFSLVHLEDGKWQKAFEMFKIYSSKNPHPTTLFQFVDAVMRKQEKLSGITDHDLVEFLHYTLAGLDLNKLSENGPTVKAQNLVEWALTASTIYSHGYEKAAKEIIDYFRSKLGRVFGQYLTGFCLERKGDFGQAVKIFEGLLEEDPAIEVFNGLLVHPIPLSHEILCRYFGCLSHLPGQRALETAVQKAEALTGSLVSNNLALYFSEIDPVRADNLYKKVIEEDLFLLSYLNYLDFLHEQERMDEYANLAQKLRQKAETLFAANNLDQVSHVAFLDSLLDEYDETHNPDLLRILELAKEKCSAMLALAQAERELEKQK